MAKYEQNDPVNTENINSNMVPLDMIPLHGAKYLYPWTFYTDEDLKWDNIYIILVVLSYIPL